MICLFISSQQLMSPNKILAERRIPFCLISVLNHIYRKEKLIQATLYGRPSTRVRLARSHRGQGRFPTADEPASQTIRQASVSSEGRSTCHAPRPWCRWGCSVQLLTSTFMLQCTQSSGNCVFKTKNFQCVDEPVSNTILSKLAKSLLSGPTRTACAKLPAE